MDNGRPYGLITLPGTVKNLHDKWNPPEYVFEFWQVGCKIPYFNEVDFAKKKAEVLQSYNELEKQCLKT